MVGLLVMGFNLDTIGMLWYEGESIDLGFVVDHSAWIEMMADQHFFVLLQVVSFVSGEEGDEQCI